MTKICFFHLLFWLIILFFHTLIIQSDLMQINLFMIFATAFILIVRSYHYCFLFMFYGLTIDTIDGSYFGLWGLSYLLTSFIAVYFLKELNLKSLINYTAVYFFVDLLSHCIHLILLLMVFEVNLFVILLKELLPFNILPSTFLFFPFYYILKNLKFKKWLTTTI